MPFNRAIPPEPQDDAANRRVTFSWPRAWEEILDSISEGIVVADAGRDGFPIVYFNRAFAKLTGYGAAEIVGRSLDFLQGADADQEGSVTIRAALRKGERAQALLKNRRKDGSHFWNELTVFPLQDSLARITHYVGIQKNVTAKIESEQRLGEVSSELSVREGQLQATFDSMTDGIVVLDRKGNVLRMNRAAALLFDIKESPLTKAQVGALFEAYLPDGALLVPEEWPTARALNGDYVHELEYTIRRKDTGRAVVVCVSTAPILAPDDRSGQFLVSYRDITESRSVAQSRDLLAAIVESSQDAIIGKDLDGIVTSWNRGAQQVFGYSATEMVGESVRRLLPERLRAEEDDILARIRRGETVEHFETERLTKDGRKVQVSLTISPIRNAAGKITGASKIARDISGQKSIELQLRQSRKMEAIGQLTGGIAHDFNNLLGVVVGNLDLLERQVTGNEIALKRVHTAQKGAERGASLTRRLLAFSSKESLEPKPAVLAEAVRNTLELAGRAIGPEIKTFTQLDLSMPDIFVDVANLESTLLNLVVNARDAMPNGGVLSLSTEVRRLEADYPPVKAGDMEEGLYACVSGGDNGHGMSKDVLDRAFEPFFTTKPRNKGTGLGLAMVYGFAKQSGGTVRIYSEPQLGTTVSLYLPFANHSNLRDAVAVNEEQAAILDCSVLVVDDEDDLLEIAVSYLQDMGLKAHYACDGASALEILRLNPDISVILTDVIMPGGMNGAELVRRVRENHPAIRVIYCSGFPAEALAERSMTLTDGPLLRKPYQRAEFEKAIAAVMQTTAAKRGTTWPN